MIKIMRLFRTRQPPQPITEARKTDPKLDHAAVFVEKLCGKTIGADPVIEYPLITGYSNPAGNPYRERIRRMAKRWGIEMEPSRPILGFGRLNPIGTVQVHELVHVIDTSEGKYAGREPENMLESLHMEGRALFAEELYAKQHRDKMPWPVRYITTNTSAKITSAVLFGSMAFAGGVAALAHYFNIPITPGDQRVLTLLDIGGAGFLITSLLNRSYYRDLVWLSKKLGDPVAAFRLSWEKPPETWLQIMFPSRFYREEIEAARKAREREISAQ
jgi:hypothetical protein